MCWEGSLILYRAQEFKISSFMKTFYTIILFTAFCGSAIAQSWSNRAKEFTVGNGSEETPYIISEPGHLANLALKVTLDPDGYANKHYVVTQNIDLAGYEWDLPIGLGANTAFRGWFDGGGKVISNLNLKYTDYSRIWWGLFGRVENAEIKGVNLVDVEFRFGYISSNFDHYVGTLIGRASNTTVTDCSVEAAWLVGSEILATTYIGGFIGYADDLTVSNSNFTGIVDGGTRVGGFIGYAANATIDVCFSKGAVSSGMRSAGGFIGYLHQTNSITNSYSESNTTGSVCVGGFIGDINMTNEHNVSIKNCHSTGYVIAGSAFAGGFVGSFYGQVSITDSYATGTVSGRNYIGGFVGTGERDLETTLYKISDCYSTGSVVGERRAGGFIGNAVGLNVVSNFATGSVNGDRHIGGFIGYSEKSTINSSYGCGSVKGDMDAGGFIGYGNQNTVRNCFSGGAVEGNINVGGFEGNHEAGYTFSSFSLGFLVNGSKSGGFVGRNNSGFYSNCFFDRQKAGITNGTGAGSTPAGNVTAMPTSSLTQIGVPSVFLSGDWVHTTGFYPQLKAFADSPRPVTRQHSAIISVPLRLANDSETIDNVQSFFRLADKTPTGSPIIWATEHFENIAIFNGAVYAAASDSWRTLLLRTGDVERALMFRAPNGLISVEIFDINSHHPAKNGDMFTRVIKCGLTEETTFAELIIPPFTTVKPGSPVLLKANDPVEVEVIAIDGQSQKYTLLAEKYLPLDIFVQRWDDVLSINNNFATNGGYTFVEYEWRRNDVVLSNEKKGYIHLTQSGTYTATLTTQQGAKLTTCEAKITVMQAKSAVYPNPAGVGQTVRVEIGRDAARHISTMQLFDTAGNIISKQTLYDPVSEIAMPDTPGTYILQIDGKETFTCTPVRSTSKIVVE